MHLIQKTAIAALLLVAFQSQAQQRQLTEEQRQELAEQWQENKARLALTPEQEQPFKDITQKFAQQLKAIRESSASRRDKFQQARAVRDGKNKEMKVILTPEQYETYLDIQQERIEKARQRRNP